MYLDFINDSFISIFKISLGHSVYILRTVAINICIALLFERCTNIEEIISVNFFPSRQSGSPAIPTVVLVMLSGTSYDQLV